MTVAEHGRPSAPIAPGEGKSGDAAVHPARPGRAVRRLAAAVSEQTTRPFDAARLPGRRELLLAAAACLALTAALYAPHVIRGGLYYDDWALVSTGTFAGGDLDALQAYLSQGYRPGFSFSIWVLYLIGRGGQSPYLAAGAGLTAFTGWLYLVALRCVGLRPLAAWSAAALLIALPAIDATRLWMTAFPISVALGWYAAGVILATRGLRAGGRRARIGWHAAAAVAYAFALLTYELVAPLVALTALLYLPRATRRAAAVRWGADLATTAVVLLYMGTRPQQDRVASLSAGYLADRLEAVWRSAVAVFEVTLPADGILVGPLGLALLLAAAVGAGRALGARDPLAGAIRAWAAIAGAGLVFAVAGLAFLVPADPYYIVRPTGIGDRFAAIPSLGWVVLVVGLAFLVALGLATLARRPRWAAGLGLGAVLATLVTFGVQELRQQRAWRQSWELSGQVRSAVRAALPARPEPGSGVVTFRHPTFVLPADVPVFAASWDLNGAVRLLYGDPTLRARPFGPEVQCAAGGVSLDPQRAPVPYGKAWFVDATAYRGARVGSVGACRRMLEAQGP